MLVDVSGAGVLQSSEHAGRRQRFLAYLVSQPAQKIIANSESYEYPLRPGVTNTKPRRPLATLGPPTVSVDAARRRPAALELLQQVGLL